MVKRFSLWHKTLRYIFKRYQKDNCAAYAAVLTLDTLLSLVPLLAASIAIFSISPRLQGLVIQAEHKLLAHFVIDTGHEIQAYLERLSRQAAKVSVIGTLLLLATSIKMLYSLLQAFKVILKARIRQKTYLELMFSWLAWIFAPIIVGLGIAISSYIMSAPLVTNYSQYFSLLKPFLSLIPILLTTIAFGFLYMVASPFVVSRRYAFYGAFSAALLFEPTKWLFGLYILHFPSYQVLYGVLAAIPLFLLWIYISWQIVLLGAIIIEALAYKARYRSKVKLDGFSHAICWLGYFWQAQRQSKPVTINDLIAKDTVSYQVEPEEMLAIFKEKEFITITKQGYYILARDINNFSLLDCVRLFPWKLPTVERLTQLDFSYREQLLAVISGFDETCKEHLNKPLTKLYQSAA